MSTTTIDPTSWEDLRPRYEALLERPLNTADEAAQWLRDRDAITEVVYEEYANLYVATTVNTADEDARERQKRFQTEVFPEVNRMGFKLDQHFINSPGAAALDARLYEVLQRDTRTDVELFREENVPIETQEQELTREYNKLAGDLKFTWEGKDVPLMQVYSKTELPDRDVREKAWRTLFGVLHEQASDFQRILDELIKLRHAQAENAGFPNYRDYIYRKLHRFDYGPEDCAQYRASAAELIVPLSRKLDEERREALGIDKLKPWDTRAEPAGREPLRPFDDAEKLVEATSKLFNKLEPKLGKLYDSMREKRELDLSSRLNKSPGGYHIFRQHSRRPFIFMNAAGTHRDVMTLIHESGHAFHSMLAVDQPLLHYRRSPREFAEVAAMGMEMIALPHLGEYYEVAELKRAWRRHLEGVMNTLCSVAMIDGLQDWLYLNHTHSHDERNEHWYELMRTFGADTDDTGVEHLRKIGWSLVPHIFRQPFYYFEYAVAQIGALQLWLRTQEDEGAALAGYCRALELGGSRPLPEIFETAGLKFDFTPATIQKLVTAVEEKLKELPFV